MANTDRQSILEAENATALELLGQIKIAATKFNHPVQLQALAEAYAWVVSPSQAHGGGSTPAK